MVGRHLQHRPQLLYRAVEAGEGQVRQHEVQARNRDELWAGVVIIGAVGPPAWAPAVERPRPALGMAPASRAVGCRTSASGADLPAPAGRATKLGRPDCKPL
jgi:hypothetical protein